MARPFTLSPSSLGEFRENPRGWWLEKKHGLKRPRGIMSSMPNAIDAIIKARYDKHRATGTVPHELDRLGKLGATLFSDSEKLRKMRNWQGAPVFVDPQTGGRLSGALDDAIITAGAIGSLDVKTTKLRDNLGEYSARYYLLSQSAYHLMLDTELAAGGFAKHRTPITAVGDEATLTYYMPDEIEAEGDGDDIMRWRCEAVTLTVDRALAVDVMRAALACLAGPMPAPGPSNEWDSYIERYAALVAIESQKVEAQPLKEAS